MAYPLGQQLQHDENQNEAAASADEGVHVDRQVQCHQLLNRVLCAPAPAHTTRYSPQSLDPYPGGTRGERTTGLAAAKHHDQHRAGDDYQRGHEIALGKRFLEEQRGKDAVAEQGNGTERRHHRLRGEAQTDE